MGVVSLQAYVSRNRFFNREVHGVRHDFIRLSGYLIIFHDRGAIVIDAWLR
jgi:hypothetical protein